MRLGAQILLFSTFSSIEFELKKNVKSYIISVTHSSHKMGPMNTGKQD